jgi:DNA-binding transcriptional ArsR family regulator
MAHAQKNVQHRRQIDALASPVRQEIVDTIEALGGEAAAAEIAAQLGKPADGLYYHLRLLTRSGLLHEVGDAGDVRARRYRSSAGSGRLQLRYRNTERGHAGAVQRVVDGLLRIAGRDFERALARADVVTEGDRRELWASRTKGWVSPAELAEINRLLRRLGDLLRHGRNARRDRLFALAYVLAPVDPRSTRRGRATE